MNLPSYIPIIDGPMGYGVSCTDIQAGYILYQCPGCGRTVKHALVSIYVPNTTCTCNFPTCIYHMNVVGYWKHPSWLEFDEKCYWEEKGIVTQWEGALCPEKIREMRWEKEMMCRGKEFAQDVKVITPEKSQSLISKILNMLRGGENHPQQ